MSLSTVKVLHGINTPSNFYSVLESASPMANLDIVAETPAGHTQPLFTAIRNVRPVFQFTTKQVVAAMAEFGILGADLSGNCDFLYRNAANLGTRVADATTSHTRLRAAQAHGVLETITVRHDAEATAACRVVATYDGVNEPVVPVDNIALTGIAAAVSGLFTLGPVSINGSTLDGVDEMTLALNPTVEELAADGEPFVTFSHVATIAPELRLTSYSNTWATYGLDGTALTAFVGYLRAKQADGVNAANAATSHASISASAGIITVERTEATASNASRTTLRIPLRAASAAGNAVTFTTGIAIT